MTATRVESSTLLRDITLILAGSLVAALSAQVAIRLPFTPVPISLQTAMVVLIGATLGWRRGALALLVYAAEGAVGLPVFANGASGLAHLAGPTGGYIAGFVLSAAVAGWLVGRGWGSTAPRALVAFLVAGFSVYVVALPWLATLVGVERVIALGFLPFVGGDLVKLTLTAALWRAGARLTRG